VSGDFMGGDNVSGDFMGGDYVSGDFMRDDLNTYQYFDLSDFDIYNFSRDRDHSCFLSGKSWVQTLA
jgi:hypothetical protein